MKAEQVNKQPLRQNVLKTNLPFLSLAITAITALWASFHTPLLPSQNLSHTFISGCSHDYLKQNQLLLGFELLHAHHIQQRLYLYPASPSQTGTPLMNETSVTRMDETGRENCQTHRSSSRALFFHWLPANQNTAHSFGCSSWLTYCHILLHYFQAVAMPGLFQDLSHPKSEQRCAVVWWSTIKISKTTPQPPSSSQKDGS